MTYEHPNGLCERQADHIHGGTNLKVVCGIVQGILWSMDRVLQDEWRLLRRALTLAQPRVLPNGYMSTRCNFLTYTVSSLLSSPAPLSPPKTKRVQLSAKRGAGGIGVLTRVGAIRRPRLTD